jgi:hypothetical protein
MSQACFNELLGAVQQELTKENTAMRDSIPPEEKLVISIRKTGKKKIPHELS